MTDKQTFYFYAEELELQLNLVHKLRADNAPDYIIAEQEQDLEWIRAILKGFPVEWSILNRPHNPKDLCTFNLKEIPQAEE